MTKAEELAAFAVRAAFEDLSEAACRALKIGVLAQEDLKRVTQTILKRYNAEIHSQSAIEAVLELRHRHGVRRTDVEAIAVDIFEVAYHIT